MSRIFLSHSSTNNAEAVALCNWLESNGWKEEIFLDLDPQRGIAAGERWERALNEAANRCVAVLFLVSKAWLASVWCRKELNLAHRLNKRLFGVLIEDLSVSDLPADLAETWQTVRLAAGRDHILLRAVLPITHKEAHVTFSLEGLQRLKHGLEEAGLDAKYFAWPPQNDSNRPPYRGLRPLEAEDAGIFFGRDAPIVEALDRLRGLRETTPPRLLIILGASGAGKSSFLRAGLFPRLARDDRNFLPLPIIRPERVAISGETGFLSALEAAFTAARIVITRADLRAAIQGGAVKLRPLLQALADKASPMASESEAKPKPPALVLSIDQAEELFLPEGLDEAQPFLALLRELLNADTPAVIAVLTIRTDQYELLQVAKELQVTRQEMLSLPPMPKGSFAEVVKEPARRLEGTPRALDVEDALVDALLADSEAGETKDALPLLAFTLERLYSEYQASGTLKLAQYNALGRVKGSIEAAVERALKAADSDPAIPKDRVTRLALLRRGLIPWLAGVDPDTGLRRRRVARLSEIPAESRPLIQHLVEQRLLATDVNKDTGKVTIEPAHEALLRQWSLLGGGSPKDSALLAVLERIKRSSADWAANNKHRAWLTHGGDRLATAERLSARPDLAANLEPIDLAYIAACRKAEADAKSRKVRGLVFTYVLLLIAIASLLAYIFRSDIRRDYRYVMVTGPYLLSQVRPYVLTAAKEQALKPGNSFSECAPPVAPLTSLCPEMVVVPAGSFQMGATDKDPGLQPDEQPQHPVTIAEPLAISRTEVTFDQWNACITGGGCTYKPNDQGWKGGLQPVINVNLKDAEQYTAWLSEVTGKTYRLLSEAEYEYAERAGTETIYPWGNDIELNGIPMANCIGCDATWGGKQTAPVGSYPKNSFGLQDMAGNVWEWTEDCDHPNYNGAPTDGSAWVDGGDCDNHMVRGGVWVLGKDDVRAAYREPTATVDRGRDLGFRVARTLPVP